MTPEQEQRKREREGLAKLTQDQRDQLLEQRQRSKIRDVAAQYGMTTVELEYCPNCRGQREQGAARHQSPCATCQSDGHSACQHRR